MFVRISLALHRFLCSHNNIFICIKYHQRVFNKIPNALPLSLARLHKVSIIKWTTIKYFKYLSYHYLKHALTFTLGDCCFDIDQQTATPMPYEDVKKWSFKFAHDSKNYTISLTLWSSLSQWSSSFVKHWKLFRSLYCASNFAISRIMNLCDVFGFFFGINLNQCKCALDLGKMRYLILMPTSFNMFAGIFATKLNKRQQSFTKLNHWNVLYFYICAVHVFESLYIEILSSNKNFCEKKPPLWISIICNFESWSLRCAFIWIATMWPIIKYESRFV